MTDAIVYVDRSQILDGKLEEVKERIDGLVGFVDAHEPQLVFYGFFIDEDAMQMTVVAIHPDAASLEFHMEVAGVEFRKMSSLIELKAIEVYGRPSEKAMGQLRHKADMLGSGGAVLVQAPYAGFARLAGSYSLRQT